MVFINYGLEYTKWKLIIDMQDIKTKKEVRISSFFAGIITGMMTPNMQGNFLGRMYYFPKENRNNIIVLTLLGNFAALLVTIILGGIAIYFFRYRTFTKELYNFYPYIITLLSFLLIFYFNFHRIVFLKKKWKWYNRMSLAILENASFPIKTLIISLARYCVYSTQFVFFLIACGMTYSTDLWSYVALIYLITTLIPSAFLGKIGVREGVSLTILSHYSFDGNAILTASLLIWLINLVFPTLVGLIICKRK